MAYAPNNFSTAAAIRRSRRSWPLRAASIRPTGKPSPRGSGSEIAHRSKKLTIAALRSAIWLPRERGFGVPALRDGRRRDCAGRQYDGVEIGKVSIHGPHHRGTIADQNYVIGCGNPAPAFD